LVDRLHKVIDRPRSSQKRRGNKLTTYNLAPRAGLEPATQWLQLLQNFHFGLDYLITIFETCVPNLGSGRYLGLLVVFLIP